MAKIKSRLEIETIRKSGKILAEVLKILAKNAKAGTMLKNLDALAYKLIKEKNAIPAFLGYRPDGAARPYQASICASVNDVVVHGLPDSYVLKNGDLLKIDLGVKYRGFYSDAATTIPIGKISKQTKKLVKAARKALFEGIKSAKPAKNIGDIGWAIEKTAKKFGVYVIKELTGHGIGSELHEEPTIYNFGEKGEGMKIEPGMVLAIEPMFSLGSEKIKQLKDESWATTDNSLSAHFEHTILITKNGSEILTK